MIAISRRRCVRLPLVMLLALLVSASFAAPDAPASHWVGTWSTAPRAESAPAETLPLAGATLRQFVHVSLGGHRVRLRLSNLFGATVLSLHDARLALAGAAGAIQPGTDRVLLFHGAPAASIPPGASLESDPLEFDLPSLADVAVTVYFNEVPAVQTIHHGSRTTSYLQVGEALAAPALSNSIKMVHWYFITGLDVQSDGPAAAVVVLGDSLTDGRGTTTDGNDRWTDAFARRLQARPDTTGIAVLNEGIGGNRLLRDGLGTSMLARYERDVLTQPGARWVIVQAGINDIGTRLEARKHAAPFASAADIVAGYGQLIARAHAQGLRVIGTTITPYQGADFYWSADGEADRQTVNQWILAGGGFDAVIDFDAALRDPTAPSRLAAAFDSGDHLHPSIAGYTEMARVVDLNLFALPAAPPKMTMK